jgi:hypothetical protein
VFKRIVLCFPKPLVTSKDTLLVACCTCTVVCDNGFCQFVSWRLLRSQQPLSALPERDRWLSDVLSMLLAAKCILQSQLRPFLYPLKSVQTARSLSTAATAVATAVATAAPAVVMKRVTGPHDLGGLSPGMSLCSLNSSSSYTAAVTASLSFSQQLPHAGRICVCKLSAVLVPPNTMSSRFLIQHNVQLQSLQRV